MSDQFERTALIIGNDKLDKIKASKVLVIGVGGVGGFVVEGLARAGIGFIDIIDNDIVSISNINRQIIATHNTIGLNKVDVMKERILQINPNCIVNTSMEFYLPESKLDFTKYDYVVDAIDTITAKIDIAVKCSNLNVPLISSMGTGNKLDPTKFMITDLYKTQMDPVAKVLRYELRRRGIKKLNVLYSPEEPVKTGRIPGSISFVPSVAGLIICSKVIKDLM